jgi:hypothetical protein
MFWLGIIIGVLLGAGGYYLYDKYAGSVETRVKKLEGKLARIRAAL